MIRWSSQHRERPAKRLISGSGKRVTIATDGSAVQVPAGKLTRGTKLFECTIHPWMHATVTVE